MIKYNKSETRVLVFLSGLSRSIYLLPRLIVIIIIENIIISYAGISCNKNITLYVYALGHLTTIYTRLDEDDSLYVIFIIYTMILLSCV